MIGGQVYVLENADSKPSSKLLKMPKSRLQKLKLVAFRIEKVKKYL